MNFVSVKIQGYLTKVHQMHLSKNSYIKPHIGKYNMDASLIAWFTKGNPKGRCFDVFQQCLKFDTNNGARIFVRSKIYAYGTLRFHEKSLELDVCKVGIALVNKQQLSTKIRNQLREGAPLTWKNNYSRRSDFDSDDESFIYIYIYISIYIYIYIYNDIV